MSMKTARPDLEIPVEAWGTIKGATGKLRWLQRVDACIAAGIVPRSFAHLAIKLATKWINEQTGLAWRGASGLGDDIGMSQPSMIRLLENAVAAGLIFVVKRGQPGRGRTTILRLAMPELEKLKPADVLATPKNPKPADVLATQKLKPADVLATIKSGDKTSTHGAVKHPSTPKKTSTGGYEPLRENNPKRINPIERGFAARSADEVSQSATNRATTDGVIPIQRAPEGALIETFIAPHQPSRVKSEKEMGPAGADGGAHAGPGFDAVRRSGSEIFGAKGDAVAARLLAAFGNDVEDVLDTLAVAADEDDPMAYLALQVERLQNEDKLP